MRTLSNLNTLAGLYAQGAGVPKDSARVADLYQKACKGGVAEACR
jgi:TPR repeat protein